MANGDRRQAGLRKTGPMMTSPRCGAKTRTGSPCRSPAVHGKQRCRMHGGAHGSGAPQGNQNALKHGRYTREAIAERKKRDQSRAAFVDDAEFLLDPGANLPHRARQGRTNPSPQIVFLRGAQQPSTPAHVELVRPSIPRFSKSLRQPRIVSSSSKNALATSRQLHPSSRSTKAFARRVTRLAAEPSRANAISLWRSSSLRKRPRIMSLSESDQPQNARNFPDTSMS